MLLKCTILSLAVLLAGGLTYGWLYHERQADAQQTQNTGLKYSLNPEEYLAKYGRWYTLTPEQQTQLVLELDQYRQNKTRDQLVQEQQARLRADRDKLAAGQMNPGNIADFLYGPGWEKQVEEYVKRKEEMQIAQTISTVCLWIGGTLFGLCGVVGLLRLAVHVVKAVRPRLSRRPSAPEPDVPELTDIEPEVPAEIPEAPQERPKQRRRVLTLSEIPLESRSSSSGAEEPGLADEILPSPLSAARAGRSIVAAEAEDSPVAVLLADERSEEKEWSAKAEWSMHAAFGVAPTETPEASSVAAPPAAPVPHWQEQAAVVENTLKEQADDLQKQLAEFKQVAQSVQQTTREQSEPLSSTLKELAQQVSAIRDYAASQQDRVEKLQDGYDWGIIRTFCLRVIRCIDNLEYRITELSGDDAVAPLEEVKDELLFALESSGIEQYRPEINSEFRGQEKLAEAIKDKEPGSKPDQAGKIAKVIRSGYRYMLDDENCKVVRTAQVKLFG